jgi:hypothetical protein
MMADLYRFIEKLHRARIESIDSNPVFLRIPAYLTSEKARLTKPEGFPDEDLWKDMVYHFVSFVVAETVDNDKGVAYLLSDYLKKSFGDYYKLLVDQLLKHKVIKLKKQAVIGVNAKGYVLFKKPKRFELRMVELKSEKQIRRAKKQLRDIAGHQKKLYLSKKELIYQLYQPQFQIDQKEVQGYLDKFYNVAKKLLTLRLEHAENKGEAELALEKLDEVIKLALKNVRKFNDVKNLSSNVPSVQRRGLRLHTKVSTLMSGLRNFLTYEGENQLVYLDIKNSQPFHMLFLLQKKFWSRSKSIRKQDLSLKVIDEKLYKQIVTGEEGRYNALIRSLEPLGSTVKNPVLLRKSMIYGGGYSAKYFAHLVATGKLYEFISKEFKSGLHGGSKRVTLMDRESAKQAFITMLNSDDTKKNSPSSHLMSQFKSLFPVVAEVISFLKSKSNRNLAFLLQAIEAEFIIHRISLPLLKLHPEIPIYTIHDGIITTKQHAYTLLNWLRMVYSEALGIEPEVKIEELRPDIAFAGLRKYRDKKVIKILTDAIKGDAVLRPTQEELFNDLLQNLSTMKSEEGVQLRLSDESPFAYVDYSFLLP